MTTAVKDYVKYLSWRFENEGIQGIKTGLREVDTRLQGMKGGELYIVAARPGMGKTTYATNILANAATEGAKCYFSSLEMPRNQLVQRMIASTGQIPLSKLKDASVMGDQELSSRVAPAFEKVKNMNITIDDQGGVDIADIRSRCRAKYRKEGLDLLLIDYLQLIDDRTCKTRFDVVSAVSRKLKALAKELDIPVMALSQLSRAVEQRNDKRPILSDLRESGQIEQDADVIQFLYRDEVYNEHTNSKGICEVDTAKYRDGETGRDFIAFFGAQNRMTDLAHGFIPEVAPVNQPVQKGF
jgi:replicative DNA helicase